MTEPRLPSTPDADAALLRVASAAGPLLSALATRFGPAPFSVVFWTGHRLNDAQEILLDAHDGSGTLNVLGGGEAVAAAAEAFLRAARSDVANLADAFAQVEIEDRFLLARPKTSSLFPSFPMPRVLVHSERRARKIRCLGDGVPPRLQRLAGAARPGEDILVWAPETRVRRLSAHERLALRLHREILGDEVAARVDGLARGHAEHEMLGLMLRRTAGAAHLSFRFDSEWEDCVAVFDAAP